MPHSLVLNLQARSPIQPGYLTGKHLHALFLTLVSSVDPELGDRLHAQTTNKAFALSPLQKGDRPDDLQWQHTRPIPAGMPCWWRISLLDDQLFGNLSRLWLNLNPQHSWHLGAADLFITSILGTPQSTQPWAGFASYHQLYETASAEASQIHFRFFTPTAFRQGTFDSALPSRENVFGSLLRRWNEYSPVPLSESIIDYLFPSYFDLRTELVKDARSKFIGCVGSLSFRILGAAEAETIRQINTLADYALYAGVGRKTPMGMGMTRRIA
ncbi:CRISPR-associated endoribonuclease Cas6 [Thermoleptolyngbya sp.]